MAAAKSEQCELNRGELPAGSEAQTQRRFRGSFVRQERELEGWHSPLLRAVFSTSKVKQSFGFVDHCRGSALDHPFA